MLIAQVIFLLERGHRHMKLKTPLITASTHRLQPAAGVNIIVSYRIVSYCIVVSERRTAIAHAEADRRVKYPDAVDRVVRAECRRQRAEVRVGDEALLLTDVHLDPAVVARRSLVRCSPHNSRPIVLRRSCQGRSKEGEGARPVVKSLPPLPSSPK